MTDIDQLVEQAAKNIFEHDDFGKLIPGVEQKPRWVERGNSGAQMIARSIAETAFSETLIAEWRAQKAEIEKLREALEGISITAQHSSHCSPDQGLHAIWSEATQALETD